MLRFLAEWKQARQYRRKVEDWLVVLFCGFPESLLRNVRACVNVDAIALQMRKEGEPAAACALYATRYLLDAIVDNMDEDERLEALAAIEKHDTGSVAYKGFNYMAQVMEQAVAKGDAKEAAAAICLNTYMRRLQGLSSEAAFSRAIEDQVNAVAAGMLRS